MVHGRHPEAARLGRSVRLVRSRRWARASPIRTPRSRRRAAIFAPRSDLTLAIEEEFQILDRETLALTYGFEPLKARCDETAAGASTWPAS